MQNLSDDLKIPAQYLQDKEKRIAHLKILRDEEVKTFPDVFCVLFWFPAGDSRIPITSQQFPIFEFGWLIGCLFGCSIDWSNDWSIDWLMDWSIDWLIDWLWCYCHDKFPFNFLYRLQSASNWTGRAKYSKNKPSSSRGSSIKKRKPGEARISRAAPPCSSTN